MRQKLQYCTIAGYHSAGCQNNIFGRWKASLIAATVVLVVVLVLLVVTVFEKNA